MEDPRAMLPRINELLVALASKSEEKIEQDIFMCATLFCNMKLVRKYHTHTHTIFILI